MYDPNSKNPGICEYIFHSALKVFSNENSVVPTSMLIVIAQYLVPVVFFLLIDKPHDCFQCLGKDPDRIYSSFQLKKSERIARKMFAKYSSKPKDSNGKLRNE